MSPSETPSLADPDARLHALADWLDTLPGDYALAVGTMRPASSDASAAANNSSGVLVSAA